MNKNRNKQSKDSPEVVRRRQLRQNQQRLIQKWEFTKTEIESLKYRINTFEPVDIDDPKLYEEANLERVCRIPNFSSWPNHCIWYESIREQPTLGSCGFVHSIEFSDHTLAKFSRGPLFIVSLIFWYLFSGQILFPESDSEILTNLFIFIYVTLPLIFKIWLVPILIGNVNYPGKKKKCNNSRKSLDVYCETHRNQIKNSTPDQITKFSYPPIKVPSKNSLEKMAREIYIQRNVEHKSNLMNELKNQKLSFKSIEKDLEIVRDELANLESKLRRKKLPENMRLAIYAKYEFRCAICEVDLKLVKPHIDHIVPIAKGGKDDLSNLQPLCEPCNLKKGSKFYSD